MEMSEDSLPMYQIDIEEKLPKPTRIRAIVHYNSGRTEEVLGKLNKSGLPDARYLKKISDLKKFPTVKKIQEQKI